MEIYECADALESDLVVAKFWLDWQSFVRNFRAFQDIFKNIFLEFEGVQNYESFRLVSFSQFCFESYLHERVSSLYSIDGNRMPYVIKK